MKSIFCLVGIHHWRRIKSIKASNLIFLIKKYSNILGNSKYKINDDYIVEDRKCSKCDIKDLKIEVTKKYFEELLIQHLKLKK